jgi:iron complex outermembrane receptor protein
MSVSLVGVPAWAEVAGRVTSASGIPIEHARLVAPDGETHFTDLRGTFLFPALEVPTSLLATHPRFLDLEIEVTASPVEVELEAKQEIFEAIAVSASPGEESFAPSSSTASVIDVSQLILPAATLAEVVVAVPGVAENGQGGIFQTYSIRGVGRQRVLTLLSGMRIVGERRAGVSASFIDPGLLGNVDVLRGPSSTYYGSGALGGVIQMFPRGFDDVTVELGYESNGAGGRQLVGWGNGAWSLGLAHRQSGKGETANGVALNDGFDQTSTVLSRSWTRGEIDYSVLTVASKGTDIGKANTDPPGRESIYPDETHALLRFAMRSKQGWGFEAWAHPNDLETRVDRDGQRTTTINEALDLGLNWHGRYRWDEHTSVGFGVDYFGRRKVEARETIGPIDGRGPELTQMPLDGSEDELGLYGAFERNWSGVVLLLGGRLAVQQQTQAGAENRDQTALSGFAGLVVPLGSSFELAANVGSGLRFASLSERFFTGVTPRGFVVSNPALEPERSRSIDLALRYYGNRLYLSAGGFVTRVRDYIERVELATEELTFVNLTEGDLDGLELDGAYRLNKEWSLAFGGHLVNGRGRDDTPLADVPADRLFARGSWRRGPWTAATRWEHRFAKNDPGAGENAIGAADLVSLAAVRDLGRGLSLGIAASNLLDEAYFTAADDKAPLARGRSISLTLGWQR